MPRFLWLPSTLCLGLALGGPAWAADPATEGSQPDSPPEEVAPEEPEGPEPALVKGLSWDILAGGVPTSGAIAQAELGITGLPKVGYHYSLKQGLSVGGSVGLDWGYYHVQKPLFALQLQGSVRYSLLRSESLSIGLRSDPGFLYNFATSVFGITLPVGANLGYTVDDRLIVGGGIDLPLLIAFSGEASGLVVPLLFGPVAEYHVSPPLAVTLDAKLGPIFYSGGGGADFGLKVMVGVAYRI